MRSSLLGKAQRKPFAQSFQVGHSEPFAHKEDSLDRKSQQNQRQIQDNLRHRHVLIYQVNAVFRSQADFKVIVA